MAHFLGGQESSWHVARAQLIRVARYFLNPRFQVSVQDLVDQRGVVAIVHKPMHGEDVVDNGRPELSCVAFLETVHSFGHLKCIFTLDVDRVCRCRVELIINAIGIPLPIEVGHEQLLVFLRLKVLVTQDSVQPVDRKFVMLVWRLLLLKLLSLALFISLFLLVYVLFIGVSIYAVCVIAPFTLLVLP